MTSAITAPELNDRQDDALYRANVMGFGDTVDQGEGEYSLGIANHILPLRELPPQYVIWSHPGTGNCEPKLTQYGEDADALIVVDFEEPVDDFPVDHRDVVAFLRGNGRPIVAEKLVSMLEDMREDPDDSTIDIVSLREMAWFLVENKDFSDPFIGPDRHGIIHAQWRFAGNGVLVISFLGYGEILLVAQADAGHFEEILDISKRGPEKAIIKEFGHFVPRRY